MMAELFEVEVNTINYHIKEIFKRGELEEVSTIRKFRIVKNEGSRNVVYDAYFGHTTPQITFPLGGEARIFTGKDSKIIITKD